MACFLMLRFQAVAESVLKGVELFGTWRLWHPRFYLQRVRTIAVLQSLFPSIGIEIVDGIGLHHNRVDILLLGQSVEYFDPTGSQR